MSVAEEAPLKTVTRDECATQSAELRRFIDALNTEGDIQPERIPGPSLVDRYVDKPWHFTLAEVDSPPEPTLFAPMVSLERHTARFAAVRSSIDDPDGIAHLMKAIASSGLAGGMGFGRVGYFWELNPILLMIDANETWRDVVTLMNAATAAGFAQGYFAFATKSQITAPHPPHSADRMMQIANDTIEMPWKRDWNESLELARITTQCPGIAKPFAKLGDSSTDTQRQRDEFVKTAGDALLECGCHANLETVKAFAWTRWGRQWGETTKTYSVELKSAYSAAGPPEVLVAKPDAKWRDTYRLIIDASKIDASAREVYVQFKLQE